MGTRERLASLGQRGTADEDQEAEYKSQGAVHQSAVTQVPPSAGFSLLFFLLITWWRQSPTSQSRSQSTLQRGADFPKLHFSFHTLCRTQLTVGTGSCSVAARKLGLRWTHASLCLVTVSCAQSLHTGIKMQSWGCTTGAAGWTEEEQTSPPGRPREEK